jgi:hypothetical protein
MELHIERIGQFALLPVVHHSYEFTLAARAAFEQLNPCGVALEYPFVLQDLILQGIARLPRVSVLLYGEEDRNYIRIEPVDPFVEAARLGHERGVETRCIDLAMLDYPAVFEPMPDTYAIEHLGHKRYCRMVLDSLPERRLKQDEVRESAMAYHLRELERKLTWSGKLDPRRPILVLCGLSHLRSLKEKLKHDHPRPFESRPQAKLYHLSPDSLGEIMGYFPFFTAVYELQRGGKVEQIDLSNAKEKKTEQKKEGEDAFDKLAASTAAASRRAFKLIEGKKAQKLEEIVARAQQDTAAGASGRDRDEIITRYILWCRAYYEQEIGDRINPQQLFLLKNFACKYAHVKSMLLPDFYELLVAGRSCISSHFCYRMWQIGCAYPPQQGPSELETIELRAEDIFPLINKVSMNPYAPLKPRAGMPHFLRRKDKQNKDKEKNWQFSPYSICSHPPEDLTIEGYGNYLRTKGKNILSEERKRVRPFETSLLDGIDLRETIRNWHTGEIFVQECMTVKGEVDSLVVIFDEDSKNYPYTMTWLGEHEQESDMAFYATEPDERLVGPGIRKAIYGGFLMTMPPGRLYDVFSDPAYWVAENHAEKLLFAAIDYSLEKFVIYVGPKPPRPFFQVIAGRYGKRILYIPLAQLSPVMLQKIRSFHILADKSVRKYAKDYIWK